MFVDDDGQMVAADAEFAQQHVQALGFGNEDRRADQRAHLDAGFQHAAQRVLGQQDADDVVAVAFVDGKARVGGLDDRGDQVRDGLGDVQQVHARARHHDVGHDAFGHGQRAPDHLVGLGIQQGAFVGGFRTALMPSRSSGSRRTRKAGGPSGIWLRVLRCEQASRREQDKGQTSSGMDKLGKGQHNRKSMPTCNGAAQNGANPRHLRRASGYLQRYFRVDP